MGMASIFTAAQITKHYIQAPSIPVVSVDHDSGKQLLNVIQPKAHLGLMRV